MKGGSGKPTACGFLREMMGKTNVISSVHTGENSALFGAETVEDVIARTQGTLRVQSSLRTDPGSNVQALEAMRSLALPVTCVGAVILIWAIRIFFGL